MSADTGLVFAGADTTFKGSAEGEPVYFTDRGGNTIKFKKFEGNVYFPLYDLNVLKRIRTFPLRDGDVYLAAFQRTGTHWMFEVVGMLLNGTADTVELWKGSRSLEMDADEDLSKMPSPRFTNTHMRLSDGPEDLRKKNVKVIYNLRDPRDVAVSLYHIFTTVAGYEYKGKFEDFLYLFLEEKVETGGIFRHYRDAERFSEENPHIKIYWQIYEDTHQDTLKSVRQISDFLGLKRDDALCQKIADKCSFARMKTDKDGFSVKIDGKEIIYRKGQVGDWRNYFTEEMLEDYYRVYEEKMAGSRFYQRYAREKK